MKKIKNELLDLSMVSLVLFTVMNLDVNSILKLIVFVPGAFTAVVLLITIINKLFFKE